MEVLVKSRLVARDFKRGDKGREDLFAETPPLEALRLLFSWAATRRLRKRKMRKLMFVDARMAHLNPWFEEDEYIELPEECGALRGACGDLWKANLLTLRIPKSRGGLGGPMVFKI